MQPSAKTTHPAKTFTGLGRRRHRHQKLFIRISGVLIDLVVLNLFVGIPVRRYRLFT